MPAAAHRVRDLVGSGLLTRQQLLQAGVSSRTLSRAVAHGYVRRVRRALYGPAAGSGTADAVAGAVHGAGGVACGPTAAVLHGLDLVSPPDVHHVAVPRASHRSTPEGCCLHRVDLAPHEQVLVDDVPVTTVLRTVLDCAVWLPVAEAVVVGDSALRRGLVPPEAVEQAVARLPRSRSAAPVRRAAALLDGRSESVLESLARVLLAQAGLPPPVVQMPVHDEAGLVARVDLAWPQAGLVLELDGFAFHSTRRDLRRDRGRVNGLTLLGWRVLRLGWEDVVGRPELVVALVRRALAVHEP